MGDWVQQVVGQLGYLGVALLMFAETAFPPIPSEVIMPLAGLESARGAMSLTGAILAGTIGAMAGNVCWYALARTLGAERFRPFVDRWGRVLTLEWSDVERGRGWFERRGAAFVCLGRLVPTVRSIVSIPAGLLRMPLPSFLLWSTLGTAGWTALLAVAGNRLGTRYGDVAGYVGPVATGVIVVIAASYVYRVATWRRRSS